MDRELAVCADPAMMDSLRILLMAGAFTIVGFFIAEQAKANYERRRQPKVVHAEDCKLHGRKLKDCPPGSHDQQNSDDSSSQEPPTDNESGASDGRGESALPDE